MVHPTEPPAYTLSSSAPPDLPPPIPGYSALDPSFTNPLTLEPDVDADSEPQQELEELPAYPARAGQYVFLSRDVLNSVVVDVATGERVMESTTTSSPSASAAALREGEGRSEGEWGCETSLRWLTTRFGDEVGGEVCRVLWPPKGKEILGPSLLFPTASASASASNSTAHPLSSTSPTTLISPTSPSSSESPAPLQTPSSAHATSNPAEQGPILLRKWLSRSTRPGVLLRIQHSSQAYEIFTTGSVLAVRPAKGPKKRRWSLPQRRSSRSQDSSTTPDLSNSPDTGTGNGREGGSRSTSTGSKDQPTLLAIRDPHQNAELILSPLLSPHPARTRELLEIGCLLVVLLKSRRLLGREFEGQRVGDRVLGGVVRVFEGIGRAQIR